MDYRTELMQMIDKFNIESVEEFKEAEMRIVRDSRFSRIRKKKDYAGHIQMLRTVKNKAKKIDPKAIKIPESDEETQALRKAFERCLVNFSAVCDGYVQLQLMLKEKSEGASIGYTEYKTLNNKVRSIRSDFNEKMRDMDILYSDFVEYSKGDDTEDLMGLEYKTYDQI